MGGILPRAAGSGDSFTIRPMALRTIFKWFGMTNAWSMELAFAVLCLVAGAVLMPLLIYFAGISTLGRYEGGTLGHLFRTQFAGLSTASIASWIVLLGPYGIYLLFKGLKAWWRAAAP